LDSHGVACLESELVLQKNDGSELRSIVLDVESVWFALDDGVTSAHTDVIDSHLTLVTSTELELALGVGDCKQMNVSGRILVERHRLKKDVVVVGLTSDFICKINNFVNYFLNLERVWVHLFADFAFEPLPVERSHVLVRLGQRLFLLLG